MAKSSASPVSAFSPPDMRVTACSRLPRGWAISSTPSSSGSSSPSSGGTMRSSSWRSEEHTSELQSPYDLVCRLLLEKKKKKNKQTHPTPNYHTPSFHQHITADPSSHPP